MRPTLYIFFIFTFYCHHHIRFPLQIGPIGLLYVGQRELAAVATHDKNVNIIGSDDATTCIIVVVRHSGAFAEITTAKLQKPKPMFVFLVCFRFRSGGFGSFGRHWH